MYILGLAMAYNLPFVLCVVICAVTATEVEGGPPCGEIFNLNLGNIREPITLDFPAGIDNYAPGQNCQWTILSPPDTSIILRFEVFSLEAMSDKRMCLNDWIEIRAGTKPIGRFCGENVPGGNKGIEAHGSEVSLRFSSNHEVEDSGFLARISLKISKLPPNTPPLTCQKGPTVFCCDNGVTLSVADRCNEMDNCGDGSDESVAAGCSGYFQCTSLEEILAAKECNRICDCPDCSDEKDCSTHYMCMDRTTAVLKSQVCDGQRNCPNGDDERREAGCQRDECDRAPCKNNAVCSNVGASFACTCPSGWTGLTCDQDTVDDCANSPCKNSAKCFDGVDTFYCECTVGFYGKRCEKASGIWRSNALTLDGDNGVDTNSCGSIKEPCKTLQYGLARVASFSIVHLLHSAIPYTLSSWISRRVSIVGNNENSDYLPEVNFDDVIVTKTNIRTGSDIRLKGVKLSGRAYLGDARLVLESSEVEGFRLEPENQRRVKTSRSSFLIDQCNITNSSFKVGPSIYTSSEQFVLNGNGAIPGQVEMSITSSTIVDSIFYLVGKSADIQMRQSKFTSESKSSLTSYSPFLAIIGGKQNLNNIPPGGGRPPDRNTQGGSQPGSLSEGKASIIRVSDCIFSEFYTGNDIFEAAMHLIILAGVNIQVRNSQFVGNNRGLRIHVYTSDQGSVDISDSVFENNHAMGPGGGLLFGQERGYFSLVLKNNVFANNTARGKVDTFITERTKLSQITGSGGAIAVDTKPSFSPQGLGKQTRNILEISNSIFRNNTAESFGGTIYLTSEVDAILRNNSYTNTDSLKVMRARIGDILESRGRVLLSDNRFDSVSSDDTKPIISYRADRDDTFLLPQNLTLYCSPNYETRPVYDYISSNVTTNVAVLLFYCKACSTHHYSLTGSTIIMSSSPGTLTLDQTSEYKCQECPYGANCVTKIRAKPNYWGINVDNKVFMYPCPEDYCCQSGSCDSYNTCATNRVGILCGKCEAGYTESLFSTDCIFDSECGTSTWFWVVLILYGLGYVLFFVLQNEIRTLISNFSHWSKKHLFCCCHRSSRGKDTTDSNRNDDIDIRRSSEQLTDSVDKNSSYLQIVMYFVQVTSLLRISIIYHDGRDEPLGGLQNIVQDTFSLSAVGITANTCLFTGVTAVLKTWIKSGFLLYLYLIWLGLYGLAKCFHGAERLPSIVGSIPLDSRFVVAFVNLMLYTYQYFAENTFTMLKCISIESLPSQVLFVDGSVFCYQPWQYIVVAFACVYVFPYFIVLTVGPKLLKRRKISVKTYILSVILPLFSSPVLVYFYIKDHCAYKAKRSAKPLHSHMSFKEGGTVDAVVEVVAEPYRADLAGGLCWEGMIAFRRLVLVLIATLVTSALYRHLGLMLSSFIILALHLRFEPFISKSCNKLETLSLGTLLLISIMNLLKASYFESGEVPNGPADKILFIWDWIELMLIVAVPGFLLVFFLCALLLRLFALCFKTCRQLGRHGEHYDADNLHLEQGYVVNWNDITGTDISRNTEWTPNDTLSDARSYNTRYRSHRRRSLPSVRSFDFLPPQSEVDWPSWSGRNLTPITRDYSRYHDQGYFHGLH